MCYFDVSADTCHDFFQPAQSSSSVRGCSLVVLLTFHLESTERQFLTIMTFFPRIMPGCAPAATVPPPRPHTCWGTSSGTAPEPTAVASTDRSQTSSGSGTQATGRRLQSRSWMSRTPPGKTGEAPTRCSRSLRTVFQQAACSVCSAPPPVNRRGPQTAAV